MPTSPRGRLRRTALRWVAPQLLLALALGAAWWLLAPGGRTATDEGYLSAVEALGSQDAWFAVLSLAVGLAVALLWVARQGGAADTGGVAALLGAVVGAIVGSLLAWATGSVVDTLTASGAATAPGAITDLALRAPGVLLLWPMAVVALVLIDTTREMTVTWARERPAREAQRRGTDTGEAGRFMQ